VPQPTTLLRAPVVTHIIIKLKTLHQHPWGIKYEKIIILPVVLDDMKLETYCITGKQIYCVSEYDVETVLP
jgi:hypothetical protein